MAELNGEEKLKEIEQALAEAERAGYSQGYMIGFEDGQRGVGVWRERCGVLVDRLGAS